MSTAVRVRSLGGLLGAIAVCCVIADQVSKAWFVYRLGSHPYNDFLAFCQQYFTLWAGFNPETRMITQTYFPFRPDVPVWEPWVSWNLVTNTGAAWSMFTGNSLWLSVVSIVMAVTLYFIWRHYFRYHNAMTWALGGIIGGALGNFLDRFRFHEVVDFIDVKIPLIGRVFPALGDPYDFPIFNVADACAVCGTIALALYLVAADIRHVREKRLRAQAEKLRAAPVGFDPYALSDEEKAAKLAAVDELREQVRSGESFLPKSRTDMPLGLGEAEERNPAQQVRWEDALREAEDQLPPVEPISEADPGPPGFGDATPTDRLG